jgi:hypothetical protein
VTIAVVAPGVHDRWDEAQVTARRIAGALLRTAPVTVLIGGSSTRCWSEGLLDFHQHATVPRSDHRAFVLEQALTGAGRRPHERSIVHGLRDVELELFLARGEYAPGLADDVATGSYDLVVLAGVTNGDAVFAAEAVPASTQVVAAPLQRSRGALRLGVVLDVLERADAVLFSTDAESQDVEAAMVGRKPVNGRSVGAVVRTNELAKQALPASYPQSPPVVIAADWTRLADRARWCRWADLLEADLHGRATVRAIGPGANRLPDGFAGATSSSRIDLWRWMSHALAVVDAAPYTVVGIPSLEAMSFGVPVIAPAGSGATVLHADRSNGGLWFRTYAELRGCIEMLLDDDATRARLGENGRAYADDGFGSTERFIRDVNEAVQSVA